ncbi:MAG: PEGA domain-containing protein [Bryobacteraceae bacterium]|nr:PEGA domain-containing protein [Bryobacteraceae bacterium]
MLLIQPGGWAETCSVRVKTDVPGVDVELDGKREGVTPLVIHDTGCGRRQVRLSRQGYAAESRDVDLTPGAAASLFVVMRSIGGAPEIPASPMLAIHKHIAGYCKGELSLVPGGFRYAAAEGEHRFQVTYANVRDVSLSAGPAVGATPSYPNIPANLLPIRVETASGAYSFWISKGEEIDVERQKAVFRFLHASWQSARKP